MHLTFSPMCARQMGHTASCAAQASHVHKCRQGMKRMLFSSSEQTTHACSSSSSCRPRLTSACRRWTLCSCCSQRFWRWLRTMRSKVSSSPSTAANSSFRRFVNLPSHSVGVVPASRLPTRLLLPSSSASLPGPNRPRLLLGRRSLPRRSEEGGAEDGSEGAEAEEGVVVFACTGRPPGACCAAGQGCCGVGPNPFSAGEWAEATLGLPSPRRLAGLACCRLASPQPAERSSATICARSGDPFTAKAKSGVHWTFLRPAGGALSDGEGAAVGSTLNSSRLRRTSRRRHRTDSQSASRSSCLLMKGLV
mmetsp:Transcript_82711/g.246698  ORF Transcript_82711/g.246698 Transcript_82711/m.246698 type:complete len:307 (-) Transcript_82711:88-1008(-)